MQSEGIHQYVEASGAVAAEECVPMVALAVITPYFLAAFAIVAKECVLVTALAVTTSRFWAFSPKAVLL